MAAVGWKSRRMEHPNQSVKGGTGPLAQAAVTAVAATDPRDRVIPARKSDIIERLIAEEYLDQTGQDRLRQLARVLGAILHYQYFEELERLARGVFPLRPGGRPAGRSGRLRIRTRRIAA